MNTDDILGIDTKFCICWIDSNFSIFPSPNLISVLSRIALVRRAEGIFIPVVQFMPIITNPLHVTLHWPWALTEVLILQLCWEHLRPSGLKGLNSDITLAHGIPSWGLLSYPIKLSTKVAPIYLPAVAHFQTAGLARAGMCNGNSPHPAVATGPLTWACQLSTQHCNLVRHCTPFNSGAKYVIYTMWDFGTSMILIDCFGIRE